MWTESWASVDEVGVARNSTHRSNQTAACNIKQLSVLTGPPQVAKDNGAKRALIPIENRWNFLDVSAAVMERVDAILCGDPETTAMKAGLRRMNLAWRVPEVR